MGKTIREQDGVLKDPNIKYVQFVSYSPETDLENFDLRLTDDYLPMTKMLGTEDFFPFWSKDYKHLGISFANGVQGYPSIAGVKDMGDISTPILFNFKRSFAKYYHIPMDRLNDVISHISGISINEDENFYDSLEENQMYPLKGVGTNSFFNTIITFDKIRYHQDFETTISITHNKHIGVTTNQLKDRPDFTELLKYYDEFNKFGILNYDMNYYLTFSFNTLNKERRVDVYQDRKD